jgi:hypothetical protein
VVCVCMVYVCVFVVCVCDAVGTVTCFSLWHSQTSVNTLTYQYRQTLSWTWQFHTRQVTKAVSVLQCQAIWQQAAALRHLCQRSMSRCDSSVRSTHRSRSYQPVRSASSSVLLWIACWHDKAMMIVIHGPVLHADCWMHVSRAKYLVRVIYRLYGTQNAVLKW